MNVAIVQFLEVLEEHVHEWLWRRVRMVRRDVDDDSLVDDVLGMA